MKSIFILLFGMSALKLFKPSIDDRNYEFFQLENGLKVLAIQDLKADFSGAALSIDAGSKMDPKESEGLAHYLEHMVFMGSEKYPNVYIFIQVDLFDDEIKKDNGEYNA